MRKPPYGRHRRIASTRARRRPRRRPASRWRPEARRKAGTDVVGDADLSAQHAAEHAAEREALDAADRVLGETRRDKYLRLGGRVAGRLFGALLLTTGLFKAAAPQAFGQQ